MSETMGDAGGEPFAAGYGPSGLHHGVKMAAAREFLGLNYHVAG
jgi:hypothetical protein